MIDFLQKTFSYVKLRLKHFAPEIYTLLPFIHKLESIVYSCKSAIQNSESPIYHHFKITFFPFTIYSPLPGVFTR